MITTDSILTAADIRALRTCDHVCFRHSPADGSTIEPSWEARKKKPRYGIAAVSRFHQYGTENDIITDPHDNAKCFVLAYNYEVSVVRTASLSMKVGDKVKLVWTRDNNNGYIKDSECHNEHTPSHDRRLHADTLDIELQRRVGNQIRTLVFRLEMSIVPDNTARMIQRA